MSRQEEEVAKREFLDKTGRRESRYTKIPLIRKTIDN